MQTLISLILSSPLTPKGQAELIFLLMAKRPRILIDIYHGTDPEQILPMLKKLGLYASEIISSRDIGKLDYQYAVSSTQEMADELALAGERHDVVEIARLLGYPQTTVAVVMTTEGKGLLPICKYPDYVRQCVFRFPLSTNGYREEIKWLFTFEDVLAEYAPKLHRILFSHLKRPVLSPMVA